MRIRSIILAILLSWSSVGGDAGFLRGMGWSPWHAKYGWNRPREVVVQDFAILRDLHVNALRTWGPVSRKGLDVYWRHGLYLVPQIARGRMPRMQFKDGSPGQPAYAALEALADIRTHAAALAAALHGHPGLAAYNLGNEYSWVGRNKAGQYQCLGFDSLTQKAFHAALRRRFGTIERWKRLTGRADPAFEAIIPPTGAGRDLLYWEWWRFQRQTFSRFLHAGYDGIRRHDPTTPVTYALLCGGRWDAATEDADLRFLEWQGDNLYYHWDKDWGGYCLRLARRIGPGRPILLTESGINTWTFKKPEVAARLMRQMLWLLAMHPEVKGIFPFVYCDEWWHGPDPKALDVPGDAWGIVTADRKPKATYTPVRETYAAFERLNAFMAERRSPVELLVSDQVVDRWRGLAGPSVRDVCRTLYRRGVSFRLVSLLRPGDLAATPCKRLLLLDSTIPDEPDGSSPARDALRAFVRRGGRILYLNDRPWRGLYRPDGPPPDIQAIQAPGSGDPWPRIIRLLGTPSISVEAEGAKEIFWRRLTGAGRDLLLLVATGPEPVGRVVIRNAPVTGMVETDGARLTGERTPTTCVLTQFDTFALLRLGTR